MLKEKAASFLKQNLDSSEPKSDDLKESQEVGGINQEDLRLNGEQNSDFYFISETSVESEEFSEFFKKVESKLTAHGLEIKNVVQVSLHIDMERFA